VLRQKAVTSALIGASRVSQVDDCVGAARNLNFSAEDWRASKRFWPARAFEETRQPFAHGLHFRLTRPTDIRLLQW